MHYSTFLISAFFAILSCVCIRADEGIIPMPLPLQEHNDVQHFAPPHEMNFQHPEMNSYNHVPPPPPPFYFQQQHHIENMDHLNHEVQTNQIEHGEAITKQHEEDRKLFEEIMQNKFEMNHLHKELADMHHQLETMRDVGKTVNVNTNHHEVEDHTKHGDDVKKHSVKSKDVKAKLEGPPIASKQLDDTEHALKTDVKEDGVEKLFGEHKDSLLTPLLSAFGEGLGEKLGLGQHVAGLASLVPLVLVKIAAKFALISFSSRGLKALASLIPTIALLLVNGIILFLIWYQNFKAGMGEHDLTAIFNNL